MTRRILFILVIASAALFTAVARKESAPRQWPDNTDVKELKFSHTKHVKESGIACLDCHGAAKTSTRSSDNLRSNHDNCSPCHQEQVSNTCSFCHVSPDNIQPPVAPARDIIFSHEKHVAMSGVECVTCHQGLDEATIAGPKNMPTMETCTGCHNNLKATSACEVCHTNITTLIPSDHLVADFKKEHKKLTRLGALDVSCSTCHTQNFCADCHGAASLQQFGKGGLMTDPSPRVPLKDSPKQMVLQSVHSMNYKYTHGLDAKSKTTDCYSCHSEQNFCAECHATGNAVTGSFKPSWHSGAGFTTFGVGSGGGRHAELAKRDIESCVSCHDTQGADPVCITCHMDGDGVRGTDPQTHVKDYMRSEHGPWHSEPSWVCYNCHTDFNAHPGGAKGRGFCGYCHG
jgi:hypothetical protein